MEAQVAGSPELCERVTLAAEAAGFEYLLIPVGSTCWEAWIAGLSWRRAPRKSSR
jgi:alkanesulfonate monooxygenase